MLLTAGNKAGSRNLQVAQRKEDYCVYSQAEACAYPGKISSCNL